MGAPLPGNANWCQPCCVFAHCENTKPLYAQAVGLMMLLLYNIASDISTRYALTLAKVARGNPGRARPVRTREATHSGVRHTDDGSAAAAAGLGHTRPAVRIGGITQNRFLLPRALFPMYSV